MRWMHPARSRNNRNLFYERRQKALGDVKNLDEILQLPLREELANLKNYPENTFNEKLDSFYKNLDALLS